MTKTPHHWMASPYGHGEWACLHCKATNREIAVIGDPNHCPVADKARAAAPDDLVKRSSAGEIIRKYITMGHIQERAMSMLTDLPVPDNLVKLRDEMAMLLELKENWQAVAATRERNLTSLRIAEEELIELVIYFQQALSEARGGQKVNLADKAIAAYNERRKQ